jgi:tetratricopeptide (TPR) repeat protein
MNVKTQPAPAPIAPSGEHWEESFFKGLLLFLTVIAVYIPVMGGGFIYDDDQLLTKNPGIVRGDGFSDPESWRGLRSIWLPFDISESRDYAPLASTMLWAEWRIWGNNEPAAAEAVRGIGAPGYHVTNIVLHGLCALLLWALLLQIGMPGAWLAALVWGVHPVAVESVAWISERRNTLSMALLLVTLLAWFRFQQNERRRDYAAAVLLFAAALFAKSSVVMLPFVLLLSVWWMRGRLSRRDFIAAAPFFFLSLLLGLVTIYFQNFRAIGKEIVPIGGPLERLAAACFALGFYFYKTLLPVRLNFIYPEWHKTSPKLLEMLPGLAFAAAFFGLWRLRTNWSRHAIFGLGFFVLMIAPVLGLLKMAYLRLTLVADHFQYMPMAGLIALAVAGITVWHSRAKTKRAKLFFLIAAICAVGSLCCLTWLRAGLFQNEELLMTDTLRKNPNSWQAHEHLAAALFQRHDYDSALEHSKRGAELAPYLYEVHNNYGVMLRTKGHLAEALEHFKQAVEIEEHMAVLRINYADALLQANRTAEAIEQYREAAKLDPKNPVTLFKVGTVLFVAGKYDEAVVFLRETVRLAPDSKDAKQWLDAALSKKKETENK